MRAVVVDSLAMRLVRYLLHIYVYGTLVVCKLLTHCFQAYRDRNTGRSQNKDKPTGDENVRPDRRMDRHSAGTYEGRGRGGRTGRGGAYDRHSRGVGG